MWWWNDAWQGWWLIGPLMMALCMGAMALMMMFMCGGHFRHRRSEADMLDRRFDRGEINRAEYDEGRRILGI